MCDDCQTYLAAANWSSSQPVGSILSGAAIACVYFDLGLVISKDHAVAVLYGDATPLASENVVHHLKGHNPTARFEHGRGRQVVGVLYARQDATRRCICSPFVGASG